MWPDGPPGTRIGSTCARWVKLHLAAKLAPCSKEAADAVGADARAARRATAHARSIATTTEAGKRIVFLICMHFPPYLAGRREKGVGLRPCLLKLPKYQGQGRRSLCARRPLIGSLAACRVRQVALPLRLRRTSQNAVKPKFREDL